MSTVYTKTMFDGEAEEIAAGGYALSDAIPLHAYLTDAKLSLTLEVSGAGTLQVIALTQNKLGGNFTEHLFGNVVAEGYVAANGEKTVEFGLPVCLAMKLKFIETGGASSVTVEIADLAYV